MTSRKYFLWLAVWAMSWLWALPSAAASPPVEVGIKVPLAGFASMSLSEQLRVEASAVIPGFSAPLVDFEGRLAAKLYPGALELGGLSWQPFVGAGASLLSVMGEPVHGLVGLGGIEYASSELPITVFLEGSGTMLMSGSAPTLVFQLSVGARYQFML